MKWLLPRENIPLSVFEKVVVMGSFRISVADVLVMRLARRHFSEDILSVSTTRQFQSLTGLLLKVTLDVTVETLSPRADLLVSGPSRTCRCRYTHVWDLSYICKPPFLRIEQRYGYSYSHVTMLNPDLMSSYMG